MRLKISELAKKLNKTQRTIWNYMYENKIRFYQDVKHGTHYFIWNEVLEDLGHKGKEDKITIGYCRVSSHSQKKDLESQIKNVENYCVSKGYQFKIIQDIGSGLNYNKKGLNELISLIINNKIDRLVINYKDRLLRFGSEIIFKICKEYNIKVEIINQTNEVSYEQELVENMLEIITVLSAKLYGSRSHKTKNIIKSTKELLIND